MRGSPPAHSDRAEEQVLGLLRQIECHPRDWATGGPASTDRRSLERHGKLFYGDDFGAQDSGEQGLGAALERLVSRGWVHRQGELYRLADEARPRAEALRKAHLADGFGQMQIRCAASSAYRRFCRRVFGEGLLPFSLTDTRQVARLVELLAVGPRPRVLDLGCGVGTLTETLQQATGGRFTGVDLAPAAIEEARRRQDGGRPSGERRFSFHRADLDAWQPPPGTFDSIVGVDVLYFLDDLPATLRRLLRALPASGQMLFLASDLADGPEDASLPGESRLVRSLEALPVRWESWDFSAVEEELWRRQHSAARELEASFRAEGNGDLAQMLCREAERSLTWVEAGRVRRYLYRVRPRGNP